MISLNMGGGGSDFDPRETWTHMETFLVVIAG